MGSIICCNNKRKVKKESLSATVDDIPTETISDQILSMLKSTSDTLSVPDKYLSYYEKTFRISFVQLLIIVG